MGLPVEPQLFPVVPSVNSTRAATSLPLPTAAVMLAGLKKSSVRCLPEDCKDSRMSPPTF
jgi:hypothetical protein